MEVLIQRPSRSHLILCILIINYAFLQTDGKNLCDEIQPNFQECNSNVDNNIFYLRSFQKYRFVHWLWVLNPHTKVKQNECQVTSFSKFYDKTSDWTTTLSVIGIKGGTQITAWSDVEKGEFNNFGGLFIWKTE